ncbi:MAG TPA: aldolase [Planctomycetaceae bacterium]|nr:aldolase [Planctomycetaceae bacterium]
MDEQQSRIRISDVGRSLFERRYTNGSSGNISVRLDDGFLITPTNSSLGRLDPAEISKVDFDGKHLGGKPPSKEAFLHLCMFRQRPAEGAVVHLHSTWSVAVSCLADLDPEDVMPAITPYYVMRVGRLPLIEYFPPGDRDLAKAVEAKASEAHSLLLANHGPIVAGKSLDAAVNAIEELEETARLFMILKGLPTRYLSEEQCDALRQRFPS